MPEGLPPHYHLESSLWTRKLTAHTYVSTIQSAAELSLRGTPYIFQGVKNSATYYVIHPVQAGFEFYLITIFYFLIPYTRNYLVLKKQFSAIKKKCSKNFAQITKKNLYISVMHLLF